jgi:hypothetical protein
VPTLAIVLRAHESALEESNLPPHAYQACALPMSYERVKKRLWPEATLPRLTFLGSG